MKESRQIQVTDDLIQEAERWWQDPQHIVDLIDLLFLSDPGGEVVTS